MVQQYTDVFLTELDEECPERDTKGCSLRWHLWPGSGGFASCPSVPVQLAVAAWGGHTFWIPHPVDEYLTHEYREWRGPPQGNYLACDFQNKFVENSVDSKYPTWLPDADNVFDIMHKAEDR